MTVKVENTWSAVAVPPSACVVTCTITQHVVDEREQPVLHPLHAGERVVLRVGHRARSGYARGNGKGHVERHPRAPARA